MPAVPELSLAFADVGDVARAHVEAMRRPETDGERILVSIQSVYGESVKLRVVVQLRTSRGVAIAYQCNSKERPLR